MSDGPRQGGEGGWGQEPAGGFPPPPGGGTGGGSFPPPPGGSSEDYPGGRGPQGWGGQPQGQGWGEPPQQQGWGGGQPGYGGQQGYGAPPRRNGVALASMILGLVALGCLFLFFLLITVPIAIVCAIAAIITGVLGLRAAGRDGAGGRGQAITGLVTGTISLLLVGFVTVAAFTAWTQFEFETNPISDPEGFLEELEERGIEVDEEGRIDPEDLEEQLELDQPGDDSQF